MSTAVKVLAWGSKVVGLVSALDWTGSAPSHGLGIFLFGSLVKDGDSRMEKQSGHKQLNGWFKP